MPNEKKHRVTPNANASLLIERIDTLYFSAQKAFANSCYQVDQENLILKLRGGEGNMGEAKKREDRRVEESI